MSILSPLEVAELEGLAQLSDLSRLQKRRYWELTQFELRGIKPRTERHAEKTALLEKLAEDFGDIETELKGMRELNARWKDPLASPEDRPSAVFRNPKLRREFTQVLTLWNKDRIEDSLSRIQKVLKDEKASAGATDEEWVKLLTLRFRLALELSDTALAGETYQAMKSRSRCSPDTSQAGFLLAIHSLVKNDAARGLEILNTQCDPDASPFNRIKRMYWKARLRAATGVPRVEAYKELLATRVPGYYQYLAKAWLKERMEFPPNSFGTSAVLNTPVELPSNVVEIISKAKERLDASLRRDASVYLIRASQILRDNPTKEGIDGLLYVAHLLQASSQPLEAMRLYAFVSQELQEETPSLKGVSLDFLGEMFPRPFATEIELTCGEWSLDPDFVFALMRQESAFNAGAISSADARGVLQILPSVAREVARRQRYPYFQDRSLFHVNENIKMALGHLVTLKTKVNHPFFMAASYNAGYDRFLRWWRRYGTYPLDAFVEMIPVNETKNYIKLVTRNYLHYRAQRNGGWVEPDLFPLEGYSPGPLARNP